MSPLSSGTFTGNGVDRFYVLDGYRPTLSTSVITIPEGASNIKATYQYVAPSSYFVFNSALSGRFYTWNRFTVGSKNVSWSNYFSYTNTVNGRPNNSNVIDVSDLFSVGDNDLSYSYSFYSTTVGNATSWTYSGSDLGIVNLVISYDLDDLSPVPIPTPSEPDLSGSVTSNSVSWNVVSYTVPNTTTSVMPANLIGDINVSSVLSQFEVGKTYNLIFDLALPSSLTFNGSTNASLNFVNGFIGDFNATILGTGRHIYISGRGVYSGLDQDFLRFNLNYDSSQQGFFSAVDTGSSSAVAYIVVDAISSSDSSFEILKQLVDFQNSFQEAMSQSNNNLSSIDNSVQSGFNDVNNSLNNADGANDSLNQSNSEVDSALQDYKEKTDTSTQYDNIDDSFFNFEDSVFNQYVTTLTFFSSCVTLLWTSLGEFSTALSIFLVICLISTIIGIYRFASGGD